MFISTHLRKVIKCFVVASVIILSSCQQEELFEKEPSDLFSSTMFENGQAIEGQYIVVLRGNLQEFSNQEATQSSGSTFSGLRSQTMQAAQINEKEVLHRFDGIVNGFAARLTAVQVEQLIRNPNVAYIEQDRYIMLRSGKLREFLNGLKSGKGKGGAATPSPEPIPTPTPTPTEPITEPTPPATIPAEPVVTPPGVYTTITPMAGEQIPWNIDRVGYGDGTGKTVWIIDSGIDTNHPDLNVDLNRSVSFIHGNSSVEDGFGHGTSVAGIIGAKNNGSGMIGVASNASIVALRVFDDVGQGSISRVISAVNHASIHAKPGDVINMSLGSGISTTLDNAVKAAAGKGILFAVAAGNTGIDCAGTSPARIEAGGVYTVSAMDSFNRLWISSNYGAAVDFAAPGVNVTVTTKGGGIGGGGNGTSFAAPHVAGILLLRGSVNSQGTITGDKDDKPDPIASLR
ncbi:S8 family serine peptidase [Pontibacter locisalis]|uniref:S8 family serine peptidase n=1 Tax=Pontibacter locisalis TaxID=1719035 RepID=A0ABW5IRX2_9BACT